MRLDKFISNNTDLSRTDAKKLVKAGRILVNDEPAESHDLKIKSKSDVITLDGKIVKPIGHIYLMVNKPIGYVCATKDSEHPTVIDLLRTKENFVGEAQGALPYDDLQIAGRLDVDTTGLVLVTNDGKWNHNITSPTSSCKKIYRVSLESPINPKSAELFAKGIQLEGEKKKTRPAFLEAITPQKVKLSLSEGKYHQVKRMFAATGNHVKKLHRESIAGVMLDKKLDAGQFRHLSAAELEVITNNVVKNYV